MQDWAFIVSVQIDSMSMCTDGIIHIFLLVDFVYN